MVFATRATWLAGAVTALMLSSVHGFSLAGAALHRRHMLRRSIRPGRVGDNIRTATDGSGGCTLPDWQVRGFKMTSNSDEGAAAEDPAYAAAVYDYVAPRPGLGLAPVQTFYPQADRIIAIGDVHGDEGALIACLRMSECIDGDGNWCGGTTNVVQIGDILDRGDEERGCMERLFNLKEQAAAAGGAVHVLLGNHEAMNVDWDFDYVGLGGFDGWESRDQLHTKASSFFGNIFSSVTNGLQMGGVPRILKDRAKAFTVGTGFAALTLSEMPLVIQLGDTVCVHGGLELRHLDAGLHLLNEEVSDWLRGTSPRPTLIDDETCPIWNRSFSAPADRPLTEKNARKLELVLHSMGASRIIVGHTPQIGGINSFVSNLVYEVWRTDTGMSRWVKNGPVECLEILADGSSRVLTQTGSVPGAVRRIEENATPLGKKRANSGGGERGYTKGAAPV